MKNLKKTLATIIAAVMTMLMIVIPSSAEQLEGLTFTRPMDLAKYQSPEVAAPWIPFTGWSSDKGVLKGDDWIEYCYAAVVAIGSDKVESYGEEAISKTYYKVPEGIDVTCYYDRGIYSVSDLDANGWVAFYNDERKSSANPEISGTGFEQHNGVDFFRMDYTLNGITMTNLFAPSENGDVFSINYAYHPSTGIAQKFEQDFWDVLDTVSLKQGTGSSGGKTVNTPEPTPAPAPTTAPASGKNAADYHLLSSTFNTQAVYNGPTEDASFNIDKDTMIQAITTYHWNNGNGSTPGSIAILENGVKVGEWQAESRNGNIYWDVYPDYVLKGGNYYTIVDSDNDTWSYNSGSYDMGFVELRGYGMDTSAGSASNNTAAANNDTIKIYVNGSQVFPDSDPVIINDRTLVPIRVVAEALGYKVDWDGLNQVVEVHNDDMSLRMMIGSTSLARYFYDYNGNISGTDVVNADVAPQIINDRTYLPLRAVGEGIGATVNWDGSTRSVYITRGSVGFMMDDWGGVNSEEPKYTVAWNIKDDGVYFDVVKDDKMYTFHGIKQ